MERLGDAFILGREQEVLPAGPPCEPGDTLSLALGGSAEPAAAPGEAHFQPGCAILPPRLRDVT